MRGNMVSKHTFSHFRLIWTIFFKVSTLILTGKGESCWPTKRSMKEWKPPTTECVCVYILYYIYVCVCIYVVHCHEKKNCIACCSFFPSSCPESKDVDDGKSENRGQPATHHLCMARLLSGWTSSVSPSLLPYTKQPLLQSSAGSIYTG